MSTLEVSYHFSYGECQSYRDVSDEHYLDYVISFDKGKTWEESKQAFFAKRIRNPQLFHFKNSYFLFGQSGSHGSDEEWGHNIIYCSKDGINFDDGHILKYRKYGAGAYSNGLIIKEKDKEKFLIQMSYAYSRNRTNIYHWYITTD